MANEMILIIVLDWIIRPSKQKLRKGASNEI